MHLLDAELPLFTGVQQPTGCSLFLAVMAIKITQSICEICSKCGKTAECTTKPHIAKLWPNSVSFSSFSKQVMLPPDSEKRGSATLYAIKKYGQLVATSKPFLVITKHSM